MDSYSTYQASAQTSPIAQHALLVLDAVARGGGSRHWQSLRWAAQHGLVPTQKAFLKAMHIDVDGLARLAYPTSDAVAAQLTTDLLLWFFIADDQFDERAKGSSRAEMVAVSEELLGVLLEGDPAAVRTPLGDALLDIRNRLATRMPEQWMCRFAISMQRYLDGCVLEALNRRQGVVPSQVTYRDIRRASVGTYPCFDVIELTMTSALSVDTVAHPDTEALRDIASDVVAWINDIVSHPKESAYHDPHNIISVLMAERGIGAGQALVETQAMIDAATRDFEQLAVSVLSGEHGTELAPYIIGLRNWISAVHVWSYQSERYGQDYLRLSQTASYDLLNATEQPALSKTS